MIQQLWRAWRRRGSAVKPFRTFACALRCEELEARYVLSTATIGGNPSVNEGSVYTLNLSSSGTVSVDHWFVSWGDGATQTIPGNPSSVTHIYADGLNTRSISASVTDSVGTTNSNSISVDVLNVAPTPAVNGAATVSEGSDYTLNLSTGVPTSFQFQLHLDTASIQSVAQANFGSGIPGAPFYLYLSLTNTNDSANVVHVDVTSFGGGNALTGPSGNPNIPAYGTYAVEGGSGAPVAGNKYHADLVDSGPFNLVFAAFAPGSFLDVNISGTTNYSGGTPDTFEFGIVYTDPFASPPDPDSFPELPTNLFVTPFINTNNGVSLASYDITAVPIVQSFTPDSSVNPFSLPAPIVTNTSTSDPGADTVSGWTILWGDGTSSNVAGNPPTATHIYLDGAAAPVIHASVNDEDGSYAANLVTVNVQNVAPLLAISGNSTVNEGSPYTLNLASSDPGTDNLLSWNINWGDGTSSNVAGNAASATHTFADGTIGRNITATATDEDGPFSANSQSVTVQNVARTATINGNATVNEGSPYTLNLSSSDPGADAVLNWNINWGDGTSSTVSGSSTAIHTYADGTLVRTISAIATDEDGPATSNNRSVTVNNVNPVPSIGGAPATGTGGVPINLTGSATDAGTLDTTFTFAWTLSRDGSPLPGGSGPNFSFTPTSAGTYLVTLSATDKDSGTGFTSKSVVVNVGLKLATSTAVTSNLNPSLNGQSITYTATVSSASGAPTGTVTFKDGTATLGTVSLSGNTASLNAAPFSPGAHNITATYNGDAGFLASTSPIFVQTVNAGPIDVTSYVSVARSGVVFNRATGGFSQTATITNTSANTLLSTFLVTLNNLTAGMNLTGAKFGTTALVINNPTSRNPTIRIPKALITSLAPGASFQLALTFSGSSAVGYSTSIVSDATINA